MGSRFLSHGLKQLLDYGFGLAGGFLTHFARPSGPDRDDLFAFKVIHDAFDTSNTGRERAADRVLSGKPADALANALRALLLDSVSGEVQIPLGMGWLIHHRAGIEDAQATPWQPLLDHDFVPLRDQLG